MNADTFRQIRVNAELTQTELALLLDIHRRTVENYENDRKVTGPVRILMQALHLMGKRELARMANHRVVFHPIDHR